jgi:tryptophan halogenase
MNNITGGDSMDRADLFRVCIIGDGLAAWMTAAALAKTLGRNATVLVVGDNHAGSERPAAWSAADATLPLMDGNPAPAWWDEDRCIGEANGAFSWGIACGGWADTHTAWFHPFGSIGANLGPVPFHQLAMRLRHDGLRLRLADYALPALAAQAGRFTRPSGDARSVLSTCRYALHLDTNNLAKAFRAAAKTGGVTRAPGGFAHAEHSEDGRIAAVNTTTGQRFEAELFLDCTDDGALINSLDAGWEDWSAWLPCNHVITTRLDNADMPPPWSHAEAHAAGWTRHLPLDGSLVLSSYHIAGSDGEQAALESLRRTAGETGLNNAQSKVLRAGRRREAWIKNCVALGTAAAIIEPLAVSNLQLLRSGISRLLELLPADLHPEAERREYNRRSALELDNSLEFAAAMYKTNGRRGEAFWNERRMMPVPDKLDYRMRLYSSLGRVVQYDEEPLEDTSWISLFDEQGMRPKRYHPIARGFTTENLQAHITRARAIMIEELKKMPTHAEYLSRLKQTLHQTGSGGTNS